MKGTITEFLEEFKNSTKTHEEEAIFHAMKYFETSLNDYWKSTDVDYFHKGFRQIDVIGNGNADMILWSLLACSTNDTFWELLDKYK